MVHQISRPSSEQTDDRDKQKDGSIALSTYLQTIHHDPGSYKLFENFAFAISCWCASTFFQVQWYIDEDLKVRILNRRTVYVAKPIISCYGLDSDRVEDGNQCFWDIQRRLRRKIIRLISELRLMTDPSLTEDEWTETIFAASLAIAQTSEDISFIFHNGKGKSRKILSRAIDLALRCSGLLLKLANEDSLLTL
jgi:hypothetical protein